MVKHVYAYRPVAQPARPRRKRRLLAAAEALAVGLMFLALGVWTLVLSLDESHRLGAALMEAVSR